MYRGCGPRPTRPQIQRWMSARTRQFSHRPCLRDEAIKGEKTADDSMRDSPKSQQQISHVVGRWSPDVHSLYTAIRDHMDVPPIGKFLPPGYHQVSHKDFDPEREIGFDGAELRHGPPGFEDMFRVWAGTEIDFLSEAIGLDDGPLESYETREERAPKASNALVRIAKEFHAPSADALPPRATPVILRERRSLYFMRNIPDSLKAMAIPANALSPRAAADFSLTIRPTPALLFRFSMLTKNMHLIHVDPQFTKEVYGLPAMLVHGPLTTLLMLELLRMHLTALSQTTGLLYSVCSFKTRNHAPLWVNEVITMACREAVPLPEKGTAKGEEDGTSPALRQWDVWISRTHEDKEMIAARGSATIRAVSLGKQ